MMMKKLTLISMIVTLFVALLISNHTKAVYFSEHDTDILYWHEEKNGEHFYYYHLFNQSNSSEIVALYIGYDHEFGLPQLGRTNGEIAYLPLKFFSPPGWAGQVEYTEETLKYNLYWRTGEPHHDIQAGESNYRFGVKLSNQRNDHINSNFTVIFGDSTRTTKLMSGSETKAPPKNHVLAPIYLLLLSKGIDVKFTRIKSSS